ncbi:alpha/beta fold hydrolase [Phenylobacterium sp.]|jgi:pimeloyl-ACP methyl ester carboxylesterase|uniref:alpha/beta fold hydrolase n=1 Tax=Phenylobacterium sp. TaxID=1871053 RepID=UPI002E318E61|nr:alpha/beta fold hydrolase [Phenylobacterium sp.]HEX4712952.1 alpha/beta fold hydrolase [Phenylobacterium sp.]
MSQFRVTTRQTRAGKIAFYTAISALTPNLPVVVFLHGALRNASVLAPWGDLLAGVAEVVILELPGHGRSEPIASATVQAMAEAIHEALADAFSDRRVLLVGESLGGTIALAIGGIADPAWLRAVFAADPPVTTAKLWSVDNNFRRLLEREPNHPFAARLGRDAFGISADDIEEIIYYPLIGALRVPTLIATGDVRLLPPRRLKGVTCLFDAVDRFVVERLYPDRARVHQIANCGHLLLVEAEAECLALIKSTLAEHVDVVSGLP